MRTIIWVFISILLAAMAGYGVALSSRHSTRQTLADLEVQPGLVDNDSGQSNGGRESSRYTR